MKLKWYQIHYYRIIETQADAPVPLELTIQGTRCPALLGAPAFPYISLGSAEMDKHDVPRNWAEYYAVALDSAELDCLYGERYIVQLGEIQVADVRKIAAERSSSPAWPSRRSRIGAGLPYGAAFDAITGRPYQTEPLPAYHRGGTIVQPTSYSIQRPKKVHWNINGPAGEYLIRYGLKRMGKSGRLFVDGPIGDQSRFFKDGVWGGELWTYQCPGDPWEAQADHYIHGMLRIFRAIKRRFAEKYNRPAEIFVNELRTHSTLQDRCLARYIEEPESFDGMMWENRFWLKDRCTAIDVMADWALWLKGRGKPLLFAATPAKADLVKRIYWFLLLLADDNIMAYLSPDYTKPMAAWGFYRKPLTTTGPLMFVRGEWRRRCGRKEIRFSGPALDAAGIRLAGFWRRLWESLLPRRRDGWPPASTYLTNSLGRGAV